MTTTAGDPLNDADWCMVELHQANPLLDVTGQSHVSIIEQTSRDDEGGFSIIEHSRPSFAQVAALKSDGSCLPTPLQSPTMDAILATNTRQVDTGKYGSEYKLKKSGKKYAATRT